MYQHNMVSTTTANEEDQVPVSTTLEYNYEWFQNYSTKIDRTTQKLEVGAFDLIRGIKKKLHIKEFNQSIRTVHIHKKTKAFQRNENEVMHDIYKILNKITEKTYAKLSEELLGIIDTLMENESAQKEEICKKFFEIIRNNSICSKLYAKLYYKMIENHDVFKTIFQDHVTEYLDNFKQITYVSANIDYDQYCLYVKKIDAMKNFTLFLNHCVYYSICGLDEIVDIILYFQSQLTEHMEEDEYIYENEQMTDALYLFMKDIAEVIVFNEKWEVIEKNHRSLCEIQGPGKNNKIKFKLMDITDCINKISK